METIKFRCEGKEGVSLLMHNSRLANPFDPFAIASKAITSKKKKTEEDAMMIYWLEWAGGLYVDAKINPEVAEKTVAHPVIPAQNILSFINDGARHVKKGQDVWRGVQIVEPSIPLLETGWPKKPLGTIHTSGDYTDIRCVVNPSTGARVMRCRPIFPKWALEFSLIFNPEILSRKEVIGFVERAGNINGLCDGKPLFGRCNVVAD